MKIIDYFGKKLLNQLFFQNELYRIKLQLTLYFL